MNHSSTSETATPDVKKSRKISKVWVIPFLGLFLGLWLVKRSHDEKGELIIVTFENAEGIEVDKTDVRCRNVKIGKVESIILDPQKLNVEVGLRIKPEHLQLVNEGSTFWVVRPRISGASISGLNTILSGSYVELDPGSGGARLSRFVGEEQPPLTPSSVPGLRLSLDSENPGGVDIGSGVYYQGNLVGKIERRDFNPNLHSTNFGVFIEKEFSGLVNSETRFWQDNGINLDIGAEGFHLELPSVESLLSGRVNFGIPEGASEGEPIANGTQTFKLYADQQAAKDSTFKSAADFLLLLERSVRGLNTGATVEFRGLRVGRVQEISYQLSKDSTVQKTPVLIQLNEHLLNKHFPPSFRDEGADGLKSALDKGLHAAVKPSNLLTGQMFVELDYYPDLAPAQMSQNGDYFVLPTVEAGFERLEEKVAALLDKMNTLEVESLITKIGQTSDEATQALSNINGVLVAKDGIVTDARTTLQEITKTVNSLKTLVEADDTQELSGDLRKTLAQLNTSLKPLSNNGDIYGDLRRTLDEFRSTMRSIEKMTTEISDKPNSLIFGKDPSSKRIPRARKR